MTLNLGAAIAVISSIRTEVAQRTGCTEWDNGGIRAALVGTDGAAWDVLAAACLAAADSSLRYPSPNALVAHWPKNATAEPRRSVSVPCPDHPQHDHPCPECRAEADALDEDARLAAAADVRAALASAEKYKAPMHIPKPAATPHDETLARARARIEQEKRK